MTYVEARCNGVRMLSACALALLVLACAETTENKPRVDSSTNWLLACETSADCGELSCLCGVCNVTCGNDDACSRLDGDATCAAAQVQTAGCGLVEANVCILRCSRDADCAAGLACEAGLCTDPAAMAPGDDGGPVSVDRDGGSSDVDAAVDYGFDFTQIAVGGRHTCGLVGSDGSLLCWGSDTYGQLDGNEAGAGFTQIAGGGVHGCGLRAGGSLFCWGGGELEVGQVSGPNSISSAGFTQVAAGFQHTCALRDGSILCFGADEGGQVSGPNADTAGDVTAIACGYDHTCALRSDGSLSCWGRDLGSSVSAPNDDDGTDFTQVAAGAEHTCALRTDGSLTCWGTAEWDGEVSGPNADTARDYVQVMAAAYQTCGLHDDGSISCWGDDTDGQVSGANQGRRFTGFIQLSGSLEVDGNHLCALQGDGTVSCWGSDSDGQLSGLDELARQPR